MTLPAPQLTPSARSAAVEEILATEIALRRAAAGRLEAFLATYLPRDFTARSGTYQRSVFADLTACVLQQPIGDRGVVDSLAMACPRGHGKTTTVTKGFALWVCCEWASMPHFQGEPPFILIVSDTVGQARDRALDLRDELEGNEALRAAYGDLARVAETDAIRPRKGQPTYRKRRKWTETDFTTTTGVRVVALGAGSKVRGLLRSGRRPSLILVDDLENDEHVQTSAARAKLERWLNKALIPTGLEGRVLTVMIGTILHADSLLSRLLSADDYPGWLKRRYAALTNDGGLPDAEGHNVLWPELWSRARLLSRRAKIGTVAFAQEYLNLPIDEGATLFRRVWLEAALQRGKGLGFLYAPPPRIPFDVATSAWVLERAAGYQVIVTAWDLGIVDDEQAARDRDTDYTVGITIGLTWDDRLELRRLWRGRGLTPNAVRDRVVAEQAVVEADYVVVENNAAQRLHEIELRGVEGLPIRGHTTDKKKHSVYEGVPGLAMLLELGRLAFGWSDDRERKKLEALITELHGLGVEAHDDCVLALWMAVVCVRKWQRVRDEARRRRRGPPPPDYLGIPGRREAA